ncbi:DsbA family oxidoreductase [Variovorax sp. VNK109]|uniref:DsbA family oxidoreductase n=1 Tax=Variovorax sp. VNK109 TaxID=3400919 RepID=UPI003C07AB03
MTTATTATTASAAPTLKIDFVSDVSCPWCAIGLSALEQAIERVGSEVKAELHFQPFELNPQMWAGGQEITEHLSQKYGSTAEQQASIRETIRQRGEAVGFTFRMEGRDRIYNTFNAHRLLHWADVEGAPGQQHALKKALFTAYFTDGKAPESSDVLLDAVRSAGLDDRRAAEVLAGDEFAAETREAEQMYLNAGIHSVPAIIFNDRHLISGGQPVEVFEQALRQLAAEAA